MNIRRKLVINSNQTWSESHINNECNNGNDNDPESLGEDHSSHSQRDKTKRIQITQDPTKLTYELSTTNILDKNDPQISIYTLNDQEYYAHTHMYLFLFSFSFFLFLHIYKCTYPEHKQTSPKYDINNGQTRSKVTKTLSDKMTFSN